MKIDHALLLILFVILSAAAYVAADHAMNLPPYEGPQPASSDANPGADCMGAGVFN